MAGAAAANPCEGAPRTFLFNPARDICRRAEVREVNGVVVDTLARAGRAAPVNARVVEMALAIEAGRLAAGTDNIAALCDGMAQAAA